ncbi:tyrosine-type recombinase/integrase, partial [Streptococcus suis]
VLKRVEDDLIANCETLYGFKWTKHVTPHSFRHMHISYLQSKEMSIKISDIMSRVGHANYETTMVYTHKLKRSEGNTVQALNNFVENNAFHFLALQKWSCKYSQKIYSLIEESYKLGKLELSLD